MNFPDSRLDRVVQQLATNYRGPGGACAVVRNGEVLVRHAWGWANAEAKILWTPRTKFRICSITKQFTCSVLLEHYPDPTVLDADVLGRLPLLVQAPPRTLHLCHNQSGLRDYWALAMLHGALPERRVDGGDALRLMRGSKSLQFTPGTRYSYSNHNFRLLSDILESRTGRGFEELLRSAVFERAGMEGATLLPETRAMPDGTEGYEGSVETGFRPAVNRISWTGDAGIAACLDDMIAWEQFIHRCRDDSSSFYHTLSAPARFGDGTSAGYSFGLSHRPVLGHPATGHGGALRGWRSHRVYLPAERLSAVVLFNHEADAQAATTDLLAAALGVEPSLSKVAVTPHWSGDYVEPETKLAVRIDAQPQGLVRLRYGHHPETLELAPDGAVAGYATRLTWQDGGLWMHRPEDNQLSQLVRCAGAATGDVAGRYRCDELDTELTIADAGGALYGAFSGFLGQGRMEMLEAIAADLWAIPCPRAVDSTPPGDWTVIFMRDAGGKPAAAEIGCWLARGLIYRRVT